MREEINKLEEEIKKLCEDTYGRSCSEIIELVEETYYFELAITEKPKTIALCKLFIRMIKKDKEKGAIKVKVRALKVEREKKK